MSGNDGDKKQDISSDYGELRGHIIFVDVRRGSRYQETSHYSPLHNGENVDGDWRGGYRYHTRNCYSHNPGDHGIFLIVSVAYLRVHEIIHVKKRGNSSGDDGKCGFRFQETSHSTFQNGR